MAVEFVEQHRVKYIQQHSVSMQKKFHDLLPPMRVDNTMNVFD